MKKTKIIKRLSDRIVPHRMCRVFMDHDGDCYVNYFPVKVNEKFFLGAMEPDHADDFAVWLTDEAVASGTRRSSDVVESSVEDAFLEHTLADPNTRAFSIYDRESGRLIGQCSLHEIDWVHRTAMVGIFLFVWVAYLLIERINRWREERRFRNEDIYGEKLDGNDADRTRPSHDPPPSDRSHPTTTRR